MKQLLMVGLAVAGASSAMAAQETRVLFLGNSYTNRNNLPSLVVQLAASAGRAVVTDKNTPGGNTLGAPQSGGQPHMSNTTSLNKIAAGGWDFVVLQEQSYLPTIPFAKNQYMFPGAASLVDSVAQDNPAAEVLLYQTWGRRDGGQFCIGSSCSPDFEDFDAMQKRLTRVYGQCAEHVAGAAVPTRVAQVGEAWRRARHLDPALVLHDPDGSHPNLAGSYLAACVFYTALFDESPVGLSFDAGLGQPLAGFLQEAAAAIGLCGGIEATCPSSPNSVSALGAQLTWGGSASLVTGDLELSVSQAPAGQFGLFFYGADAAPSPLGDGSLCIGAGLTRILPPQVLDAAGSANLAFDVQEPALEVHAPLAGDTRSFQFWFRDPQGPGGSGFNFTGGVSVSFCP